MKGHPELPRNHRPLIPVTWEAEAGGRQVQGMAGQLSEAVSLW